MKEPVADVAAEPAVGAYVHGDGPHAVGDLVVDVQDQIVVRSGSNDVLQERLTPRGQQAVLAADDVVFVRDEPCQLGGSLGNVHVQDVVGESGGYQGSPLDFEPERLELVRLAAGRLPFVVVQRHVVQMVAVLGRHAEILVSERAPLRTPHVNLHGPAAVLVEHGRDPLVVRIGESVLVTDHGHRIIVEAHYIVEKGLHLALHLVHPDDAQPGKGLIHVGVLGTLWHRLCGRCQLGRQQVWGYGLEEGVQAARILRERQGILHALLKSPDQVLGYPKHNGAHCILFFFFLSLRRLHFALALALTLALALALAATSPFIEC